MELNFVRFPHDIFKLNIKIEELDGFGYQSANNLKSAINKSKEITLEKFIFSLESGTLDKRMQKF